MPQTLPSSARAYAARQRAETRAALVAIRRLWARMGEDFDASYADIERPLLEVAYVAQGRVATRAQAHIPVASADVGITVRPPEFETFPEAWVGTAGDGRAVTGLLYGAVARSKRAVALGLPPAQALTRGERYLSLATGTLLADTRRGVEQIESQARRIATYVRVLTPPSCGRCVILAGRTYGMAEAFDRHPGCDCEHMPAPDGPAATNMLADPGEYLDSLDDQALARALGSKANAQAYREFGADPAQLINAYRKGGGVRPAQVYNRSIKYTTEGTTRRGWAHDAMARADYVRAQGERQGARKVGSRYRAPASLKAPRLMPESIAQIATDRADQARLLKLYGWVL